MYSKTTQDIRVSVTPTFLEDQSDPELGEYAWAYHVRVENQGSDVVQLISRHWKITDAEGHMREVKGPGVVGEQPVLEPGDTFEYTSGTLLPTTSGIMLGNYHMLGQEKGNFDIEIPAFSLDMPGENTLLN